jgi:hypothetical protein
MERINKVNIIIGARGKGKTHLMLSVLKDIGSVKKVLIIDTFNHPKYKDFEVIEPQKVKTWLTGTKRIFVKKSSFQIIFKEIEPILKNCTVVFEDATKYIQNKVSDQLLDYIIDTKQKNIDLYFLYHSFAAVPPDVYRYCDNVTVFKTNDTPTASRLKICNFEVVNQAWKKATAHKHFYNYVTVKIN